VSETQASPVASAPGVRPAPALDDPRVVAALDEYMSAVERGSRPGRDEFLTGHAEVADVLAACLDGMEMLHGLEPGPEWTGAALGELGDFRILREVGRGGMGVVYEAEQISLGRRVALKVLPFAATMDPRQLQRFQNEARAAASLEHPHIVPVYGVGYERGVHYYAMKFIDGKSLAQVIADLRVARPDSSKGVDDHKATPFEDAGRPTRSPSNDRGSDSTGPIAALTTQRAPRDASAFRQIAELGIQAAEALEHAHSLGIVHRDIKPANLMIDGHGSLWITDFGLARTAADAGLTMTGDVLGTLRYMSPEQALAKHGLVDHRTDVYSLGVTLYELLTGTPAITGKDREEILNRITLEDLEPPRSLDATIPRDLETLVLKAMAKIPAERYATARELADDLRRFNAREPIRAKRPTVLQRAKKWSERHKPVVIAIAFVVGLATVGLAIGNYLLWQKEEQTRTALGQVEEQRSVALANEAKANEMRRQAELDLSEGFNVMRDLLSVLDKKELARISDIGRVRQELAAYILRHYQNCIDEQNPDPERRCRTIRTYTAIGMLHAMQGEPYKARAAFRKSVSLSEALTAEFPGEARYWLQLAGARMIQVGYLAGQDAMPDAAEEFRKAVQALETTAELGPDDPRTLNYLAWNLTISEDPTIRDPARAVVLARRATELAPDKGAIWDTLGVACYRAGSWGEAVTALEKGLALPSKTTTLGNDKAMTWFYLAMAHSRLGQDQKARSWYDKAARWMDENAPRDDGLNHRLRAEAAELLRIQDASLSQSKEVGPRKE
jgi:serine/threonine protein kinase